MRKSVVVAIALLAVAGGGAYLLNEGRFDALWTTLQSNASAQGQGPATTPRRAPALAVETAVAKAGTSTADIRSIGSLASDESVKVASEIAGRISSIAFSDGQAVAEGDVLFKLDGALTQAEMDDAQAKLELALANYERTSTLARSGNTTQRANDEAVANLAMARAAVALIRARFDKLTIRAPFPGIVGIRTVSVGAYVTTGQPLVNLEKIDTLNVDFKVPEIHLGDIAVGQTVEVSLDALPGRTFAGSIEAIDPQVDINGRALSVRARVPNSDMALRPGLFARILIKGSKERQVVTVPEEAIVPRGQDTFVFRVEDGKAVEARVTLGNRYGGLVEIAEGVEPGAVVVTAGQQRLRDGASVEVVTSTAAQG